MDTINTLQGQSLLDISVEYSGSLSNVVDWAIVNGVSVTGALTVDTALSKTDVDDQQVANLFENIFHKPASALSADDEAIISEIEPTPGIFDDSFDETYE